MHQKHPPAKVAVARVGSGAGWSSAPAAMPATTSASAAPRARERIRAVAMLTVWMPAAGRWCRRCLLAVLARQQLEQVDAAGGVAGLVVVPAHDLEESPVELDARGGV